MRRSKGIWSVMVAATALFSAAAGAEEHPYTQGTVWVMTMVHIKNGLGDTYFNEVIPLRKKIDDEAKKAGILVSSHILSGASSGRDDFDVVFLDEYKDWAAFDTLNARYESIQEKIVGGQDKATQLMVKRSDVREILGTKLMQELIPKS